MADLPRVGATSQIVGVTLVTTAETILNTVPAIPVPNVAGLCLIIGWAQVLLGTNATSLTLRLRRGTLVTGALVGVAQLEQGAAGNVVDQIIIATDPLASQDADQYVLTAVQNAATANGNVVQS